MQYSDFSIPKSVLEKAAETSTSPQTAAVTANILQTVVTTSPVSAPCSYRCLPGYGGFPYGQCHALASGRVCCMHAVTSFIAVMYMRSGLY